MKKRNQRKALGWYILDFARGRVVGAVEKAVLVLVEDSRESDVDAILLASGQRRREVDGQKLGVVRRQRPA